MQNINFRGMLKKYPTEEFVIAQLLVSIYLGEDSSQGYE